MIIAPVERLLFDYSAENFETWDVPDVPTRAYRDINNQVHLIQSHYINRASVGPDFDHLVHQIPLIYQGGENPDPAKFDNRVWIGATWTLDGQSIYAIGHVENYAYDWYNVLVSLVSSDGGTTWSKQDPYLAAAIPYTAQAAKADPGTDAHNGFFEPSNIFKGPDGACYMFANVVSPDAGQVDGNCLMRMSNPMGGRWRGYYNGAFAIRVGADPYTETLIPSENRITPITVGFQPRCVVKHIPSGLYIAVGNTQKTIAGNLVPGQYFSTSTDLITWVGPTLLLADNRDKKSKTMDHVSLLPALIDPNSTSRNFDTIMGNECLLTLVRIKLANGATTTDRDIVAIPVTIAP